MCIRDRFIPLCNELRQKKFEVGRECRKLSKEIRHKENPTDADYNKVIDECLDVEIKEAQLEKEYFERFKKILSPEKVYKYRNAEYKFEMCIRDRLTFLSWRKNWVCL